MARPVVLFLFLFLLHYSAFPNKGNALHTRIIRNIKKSEIKLAELYLREKPMTVTSAQCERSKGALHDFYSEGDYWWPDPQNPAGPYMQRDGESNPENFSNHRHAMIRLSEVTATLTSAWLMTGRQKYAAKALEHLKAWFVDTATLMNPNMLYAQAIKGRFTGRGIGLIDAYHLVEVAQSVKVLTEKGGISVSDSEKIKAWFVKFLDWMTTHKYGLDEMNAENNHGTCWVVTASAMAVLTDNQEIVKMCRNRFKKILLPGQMSNDGSFPREIKRTKPYGYSLFNIDAFCIAAQILSVPEENLWEFKTSENHSLAKGMAFIYPFMEDKGKWLFAKDVFIWDE